MTTAERFRAIRETALTLSETSEGEDGYIAFLANEILRLAEPAILSTSTTDRQEGVRP